MAITVSSQPSYDANQTVGKHYSTDLYDGSNLFYDTFGKPEWDDLVYQQDSKYIISLMLESMGQEETNNGTYFWSEFATPYVQQTISNASFVAQDPGECDIDTVETDQYFIPGDVVMGPVATTAGGQNKLYYVVSWTAGTYRLRSADGANIVTGDMTDNGQLSYITNVHGECSTLPGVVKQWPEKFSNRTSVTRDAYTICDWAAEQVTWIGKGENAKWYHEQQELCRIRHKRSVDAKLLFGQSTAFTSDLHMGSGIVDTILTYGSYVTFGAAIDETETRELLKHLITAGRATEDEYLIYAGIDLVNDLETAWAVYLDDGAEDYGPYGAMKEVGTNVDAYKGLGGARVRVVHYYPFSDGSFLPSGGTAWTNYGIVLNLGNLTGGKPSMSCVWRRTASGQLAKFLYNWKKGVTFAQGGEVSTHDACLEQGFFSECGIKMPAANRHAIIEGV